MRDIGLDTSTIAPWFADEHQSPYVLVRVSDEHAAAWSDVLGVPVRRCYIEDALLDQRAQTAGRPKSELVAVKLPDRGSTMAGDFGEILVFLYHAAVDPGVNLIGPKKWRLKQDRTKPAPYSDVVQFVLPHWPEASTDDYYISLVGAVRRGNLETIRAQSEQAAAMEASALQLDPDEWVGWRLFRRILSRFEETNVRAVLPDGESEFWGPLVRSLLNRDPPHGTPRAMRVRGDCAHGRRSSRPG